MNVITKSWLILCVLLLDLVLTLPSWHLEGNPLLLAFDSFGKGIFISTHILFPTLILYLVYTTKELEEKKIIHIAMNMLITFYLLFAIIPWLLYYARIIKM